MKFKHFGVFGRVLSYTAIILFFNVIVFFCLFSGQIKNTATLTQQRQLLDLYQPLIEALTGKSEGEAAKIVEEFHMENRSFQFFIENEAGEAIYQTDSFKMPGKGLFNSPLESQGQYNAIIVDRGSGDKAFFAFKVGDMKIYASGALLAPSVYSDVLGEAVLASVLIFFGGILAAIIFARGISKPIRLLAANARKMANFEDAPNFPQRNDEIGQLAQDVYLMRQNLKDAINQLEDEVEREREMEENQRYFFQAASHELKTPIAAARAILEGMAENVIEPSDYPKYIKETLRLLKEQNTLVTEILDIVKMNDAQTRPVFEPTDLSKLVETALDQFRPIFESKDQELSLSLDAKAICCTDPRLLSKALSNALQNAAQNSPEGASINITSVVSNGACEIAIENTKAHISEAKLSKLFEPFYMEDEARSREKGRNGLGLAIVKKILDLLEASYSLENTADGVCFKMAVPLWDQQPKEAA